MRQLSVAVSALLFASAAVSEPLRCGRWVVDVPVTIAELVQKCGEPDSKRSEESDVRAVNRNGASIKIGTTVTEYWTYDRGRRAAPVVVTSVDGEVRSIERAPQ
jgi:hypothetical protein